MRRPSGSALAFASLLGALVLVGCGRPLFPDPVREGWSGLVAALALVATGLQALRARSDRDGYEGWLLAVFPLVLAALYLQPQRVASDGIFYYAPLRSVLVDFDLDFENEYRILGAEPGYFQRTVTGRLPNTWSVGPAILWSPFFLLAHAAALLGLYRPTGIGYPYFTAVATGTAFMGFAGVVLLFRLLKSYFEASVSLVAALLVWLATFHVWYMVFEPSMSHAIATASVSGFLLLTHGGLSGARGYAWMGAAGGLVALVRWQNVLFLPVALATSWAAHGRPRWRELAAGAGAFLLVFAPQLLYWRALYGSFLLIPQGGSYIDWSSPEIEGLLFSSRHGLFSWAPVLYLGLAGFPAFVRRAPVLGWSLALSALAALYVNASVSDWWAGASFGARRFDGALPAFGLGLAASVGWMGEKVRRRPLAAIAVMLSLFVLWNGMLMGTYFSGTLPPDGPASFQRAAADGVELVYRRTGYPFSWPGAILDRIRRGAPLSVYDLAGSEALANNVDIRMGETDDLYLGEGWSLPKRGREETFRLVSREGADVHVALREPAPYALEIWSRSRGEVAVRWNGGELGRARLDGVSGVTEIAIPSDRVRSGLNRLTLLPGPGEVAISRLRLTRPGEV